MPFHGMLARLALPALLYFGCCRPLLAAKQAELQASLQEISGLVLQFSAKTPADQAKWSASYQRLKQFIRPETSTDGFQLAVSQQLGALGLGFAPKALLAPSDEDFWLAQRPQPSISDFGARFRRLGKHWYVEFVVPGSAAAKAGLMRGDKIISAQAQEFRPYQLPQTKEGQPPKFIQLRFQRDPNEAIQSIRIEVKRQLPIKRLQEQVLQQATILEHNRKKIAYLPVPSLTAALLPSMKTRLQSLDQKQPDAWLLDLRSGLAGRAAGFLDLFALTESESSAAPSLSQKPIYILTNQGTIEGQEWLAWLLRKQRGAVLIGEATAGHAWESKFFYLQNGRFALRVPIADPPNNVGLIQGQGLQPDHAIPDTLVFSRGYDELKEKALQMISKKSG